MYVEALKNSDFKENFTYLEPKKIKPNNSNDNNKGTTDNCNIKEKCHKNRKRKIWFNPFFFFFANLLI